ncbi:MAG: nucleotidyltransferase family protein [Rhizobiales bacterium]|nr:nucleotidyltransferase family protein [Hyphomicrobiales bacterium]
MIKQAFILGAGFGSRMRPLTDTIPKPMVPLAGKPLIDHVIDRLTSVGVEKIVVNVHYLADVLENHLRKKNDVEIIISDERDELLDTGGGVLKALHHFGDEPFFIHNSDSVWVENGHNNLAEMVKLFDPQKMDNLLCLANRHTSLGYDGNGDFLLSNEYLISRKPKEVASDHVFIGASIATKNLFDQSPTGPFSLNKLWDAAIAKNRVYGIKHQGIWMHVGTTEALSQAEDCIRQSELTL